MLLSLAFVVCMAAAAEAAAQERSGDDERTGAPTRTLQVFLDCDGCFRSYLETEVGFVHFVRDRAEAGVHVLVTSAETASGGREYSLSFIGLGAHAGADRVLKTAVTASDQEAVVRRQLASALRIGLLPYVTAGAVPPGFDVSVRTADAQGPPAPGRDRWNHWVFSLRGTAAFDGEESSRERQLGAELGADRITPDWKVSLGFEIDHEEEEFDLDEDDPVSVSRRERDFQWLAVKGLGPHWSIGAEGDVESSTFDNRALSVTAAPAIEFNVFPYEMYTRRQLRAMYAVGVEHNRYYETTLYGRLRETRPAHEISLAFEQREPWGTLQARTEWAQYLHDLGKSRLETEGTVSLRIARGLSLTGEVSASRIRDQISLPARGATPEEVLLRLRQLQSGYEYSVGVGFTYTFGSIFSSVVNPRFGE